MGGGGGGGYFNVNRDTTKRAVETAQKEALDKAYEASCNEMLASLLTEYNDRDTDAIARRLNAITNELEKELEGTIDLLFGGSVAKRTYVDGLSDIDSLVMLDNCELAGRSPQEARIFLADRLRGAFKGAEVTEGRLAVTINFPDAEIQLLPAVSCNRNVKIADPTGERWAEISPKKFSSVLTDVNQDNGRKVVPTVKLAKAIIANLAESQQISGYHAESLAVEIFKRYKGPHRLKEMVNHFFAEGARCVLQPIRDKTGQSVHVDDYLGESLSLERRIVSDGFSRVARKMKGADLAGSVDQWSNLFGE